MTEATDPENVEAFLNALGELSIHHGLVVKGGKLEALTVGEDAVVVQYAAHEVTGELRWIERNEEV